LEEVKDLVADCAKKIEGMGEFRNIYKTCLATDCVLRRLTKRERPRLTAARGIIQRVPLLVATGQLRGVRGELRRFIELVFWCVYFSDHPVEWTAFAQNPTRGYSSERSDPITYCAFRERAFYTNYAQELFSRETSGIALEAANALAAICNELNPDAHAGRAAAGRRLIPAWDALDAPQLAALANTNRSACAAACIILAAYLKRQFNRLPAVNRAWFDWLVGPSMAKRIRSGAFGL
jgi:hypothetical protein